MNTPQIVEDKSLIFSILQKLDLDQFNDENLERFTRLAIRVFNAPIAIIAIIEQEQLRVKSIQGLNSADVSIDLSALAATLKQSQPLVLSDVPGHQLFSPNPINSEGQVLRFYAGQALIYKDIPIGVFCIFDFEPRNLDQADFQAFQDLVTLVQEYFARSLQDFSSERKQEPDDLAPKDTNLISAAENLPDLVVRTDLDGRFCYVNLAFEKFINKSRNLLIGKPLLESGLSEYVCKLWLDNLKEVVRTRLPQEFEANFQLSENSPFCCYQFQIVPEFGFDGKITYILGTAKDVTLMQKVEAELRQSQQLFVTLFNTAPVSLSVVRISDGIYLEVNEQFLNMRGYTREEVIGHSGKELGWASNDVRTLLVEEIIRRDTVFDWEYNVRTKSGQTIYGLISACKIVYNGEVCALITFIDMTERRRFEIELSQSQAHFASLFQVAPVSLMLFRFSDGVHLEINETMLRNSGFKREDIIGRSISEIGWSNPLQIEQLKNALQTQGSVSDMEYEISNIRGERRKGYLNANILSYKDEICVISSFFDATEISKMEEELTENREHLQIMVDNLPITLFTLDCDGKITSSNGNGLKAYNKIPNESNGNSIFTYFSQVPEASEWWETILSGKQVSGVVKYRNTFIDAHIVPVTNTQGEISGAFGITLDVTERALVQEELRRSEEKLMQSQKMEAIGRLAGGIAHDFNNLLTAILGYSDLLILEVTEGSSIFELVSEVKAAADRAASLTHQLLAFSRKQMLQPKTLDLNTVVASTLKLLRRLIGERFEIISKLDPELGIIKADPHQLEQVLVNLAVNARDAMEPKGDGALVIETRNAKLDEASFTAGFVAKPGDYVLLSVTDTGTGMDSVTLAHIFEPFFTTKEVGRGTGLGLSTVYGIVKQSEGYIWPYSEPGVGTCIKIYLPRIDAKVIENSPLEHIDIPKSTITETILLVEDEATVRRLTYRILAKQGFKVLEAKDGKEALEICKHYAGPIELVVSDVVMPEMTGPELAIRLRSIRPSTKILLVSGYSDPNTLDNPALRFQAGFNFLEKPFTTDALLKKLHDILSDS